MGRNFVGIDFSSKSIHISSNNMLFNVIKDINIDKANVTLQKSAGTPDDHALFSTVPHSESDLARWKTCNVSRVTLM